MMNHRSASGTTQAFVPSHQAYNMESSDRTTSTNSTLPRSNPNPKILFNLLSHANGRQSVEDQVGYHSGNVNGGVMEYNENNVADEFKVPSSASQVNPAVLHQHSMTSSASTTKTADLSAYLEHEYYQHPQQRVKPGNGNSAQHSAGDFLMPMYNRPRSKSMGNGCLVRRVPEQMNLAPPPPPVGNNGSTYWCPNGLYNSTNSVGTRSVSRTTSRDSLVSFDESIASSSVDEYGSSYSGVGGYSLPPFAAMFPSQFPYSSRRNTGDPSNFASSRRGRRIATENADVLLEDARSQLMRLTTDAGDGRPRSPSAASWQPMDDLDEQFSVSQPPSPPAVNSSLRTHLNQHQIHYYNMLQQQVQPTVRKYSEGSHQLRSRLTPGMPWRQRTSSLQTGGAVHPAVAAAVAAASQRYSDSGRNRDEIEDQSLSGPLNLSCKRVKRKKYDAVMNWPYARNRVYTVSGTGSRYGSANSSNGGFATSTPSGVSSDMTASIDEGIDNDDDASSVCSSNSILKSILLQTPRGRSYSMSVCIGRQNNAAANYPSELPAAPAWLTRARQRGSESNESSKAASSSVRSSVMASPSVQTPQQQQQQQQQPRHQRVVLAKKNQIPVTARVIEYLNKILTLVSNVPSFEMFTLADRRTLLLSSCGRLLLLCMAESNLEFAVTTVNDTTTLATPSASLSTLSEIDITPSEHQLVSGLNGDEAENLSNAAVEDLLPRTNSFSSRQPSTVVDSETPTQHFVDTVQNFIRKCQALGIDVEEYRLMGAIALFQTGSAKLTRSELADAMHAEARQRLADYIQKTRPTEKLRYSNILLALRTLFGINCAMLQSLFYRPSPGAASFNEFICNALNAATNVNGNEGIVEFDVGDDDGDMVADEIIS